MQKVYDYLNSHITGQSVIGMGSGTTMEGYIPAIAEHFKKHGISATFVPTSTGTYNVLKEYGLNTSLSITEIDLTIDGADIFTQSLDVIKGGGGSLLREKQIGYFSEEIIIVAGSHKEVASFDGYVVPVEINPFLFELTKLQIEALNTTSIEDRTTDDTLFLTDNGNYIADCTFKSIDGLDMLHNALVNIPGVVETGIFNRHINKIVTFNDEDFSVYE